LQIVDDYAGQSAKDDGGGPARGWGPCYCFAGHAWVAFAAKAGRFVDPLVDWFKYASLSHAEILSLFWRFADDWRCI
jgi:hypothetical protein